MRREGTIDLRASVLIADDHAPTRERLERTLSGDARFTVCALAGDAPGAVDAATRERPDLCVLDVRIPGGGLAAAWEIAARLPTTGILMFTVSRDDSDLFEAIRLGARGYLLKEMPVERVADALLRVLRGEVVMPGVLVARLAEEFRTREPRRRALVGTDVGPQLTSREWEVVDLMRRGLTTAEIAQRLFVSQGTVRTHIAAALRKLSIPDRSAAIRLFAAPAGRPRVRRGAPVGAPRDPPVTSS